MRTLVPNIFRFSKITIIIMFCALSTVGVKALKDCGVQTADVDSFSNPQGKTFLVDHKVVSMFIPQALHGFCLVECTVCVHVYKSWISQM